MRILVSGHVMCRVITDHAGRDALDLDDRKLSCLTAPVELDPVELSRDDILANIEKEMD